MRRTLALLACRVVLLCFGTLLFAPSVRAQAAPVLEVWTYPLQLVRGYRVTFRVEGEATETDGRSALQRVEHTPAAATRVYAGPGFTVRERVFVPVDLPGATIGYAVELSKPLLITVHFQPSLNLMWPATALWRDLVPWSALDAPGHMHELMAGNAFVPERESVPDQAWSSAAVLSTAAQGVLGLQLDGAGRRLR